MNLLHVNRNNIFLMRISLVGTSSLSDSWILISASAFSLLPYVIVLKVGEENEFVTVLWYFLCGRHWKRLFTCIVSFIPYIALVDRLSYSPPLLFFF